MWEQKDSVYKQFVLTVLVRIFSSWVVRLCSGNVGEEARGRVFEGEGRSRPGPFGFLCTGWSLLDIVIGEQVTVDMVLRGGENDGLS